MTDLFLMPSLLGKLVESAAHKGIRRGRPEALLSCLERMAADLFPDTGGLFAALFTRTATANVNPASASPRELGDAFWRSAFAGSPEAKRLAGVYYTPEPVIDQILDLVWKDLFSAGKGAVPTVCDPAMGSGFFLLRLVQRRIKAAGLKATRQWAAENLYGVDLDPAAVFMARASLWLALSDGKDEFLPQSTHLRLGDSLLGPAFGQTAASPPPPEALDWSMAFPGIAQTGGFRVIIGNPPYEVLTNFNRKPERRRLAGMLRSSGYYRDALAGQINLYRCFIEHCLDLLAPGGALSMVVPLSLARDAAALPLRKRLIESCAAKQWLLFGEREKVFPGVTQSACIFKATAGAGQAARIAVRSAGSTVRLSPADMTRYTGEAFALPALNEPGIKLWKRLWKASAKRLDAICAMRVGEVDQTFFRSCMADEDTGCLLARGAHLSPFRLDVTPAPGRQRFLRLDKFLSLKGAAADACQARAAKWRVAQLGIRNMHSRPRLVAALAPPGVYLGNSINVYEPNDGIVLEYLAGLLNSRLLDWLFCLTSGNNNINLHEMARLPVPASPSRRAVEGVATAYRHCAETLESEAYTSKARSILDKTVAQCYGIIEEWETFITTCED